MPRNQILNFESGKIARSGFNRLGPSAVHRVLLAGVGQSTPGHPTAGFRPNGENGDAAGPKEPAYFGLPRPDRDGE